MKKIVIFSAVGLSLLIGTSLIVFGSGWLVVNNRFLCEACETDSLLSKFYKSEQESKLIVLALDGVPHRIFEQVKSEGLFSEFYNSSEMTSTFPSLTKLSFSKILGSKIMPGYERSYYDQKENKLKESYSIFEHLFVLKNSVKAVSFLGSPGYIGYVLPKLFKNGVLVGLKKRILESKKQHFFGYTSVSDFLSHGEGPGALKIFLSEIDQMIKEIKRESKVPVKFILFSDHGNSLKLGKRIDLFSPLEKVGFRSAKVLKGKNDFILPVNGLVGVGAIHTLSLEKNKMCNIILQEKGVDLCFYTSGDKVIIKHPTRGAAELSKIILSDGQSKGFNYFAKTGDPLLLGVKAGLNLSRSVGNWWELTRAHQYPDALHRIWQGFNNLVKNPAQILVSLKDGFVVGPKLLSIPLAMMHTCGGTHGGLHKTQSNGFFVTDYTISPENLRAEWVYPLLRQATNGLTLKTPYKSKDLKIVDSLKIKSEVEKKL